MKKLFYLIVLTLILGLVLTGCLLSNVGQVPTSEQSGITYLTKNPSPDLVGLWHFDGNANDSSGNGNNGILGGNATYDTGKFDQALKVDGNGDYVDFGSGVTGPITGDYTVEAWIKPASLSSGRHAAVSFSYMELGQDAGKVYFWQAYDGNWGKGYQYISPSVLLDVTKFSHIVGVFHKDVGVDLYVDGNYIGSDTIKTGTTLNIFGTTYAGQWYQASPGGAWFNGIIDEVRIWDTAYAGFEVSATPEVDFNLVETEHEITATIDPVAPGVTVGLEVIDGPNEGATASDQTDARGQVTLSYTGSSDDGKDVILIWVDRNWNGSWDEGVDYAVTVEKYWLENFVTGGGKINMSTLGLNGKKVALTFGGTVGVLEGLGIVGQFQIVDHANLLREGKGAVSLHCNNFTYLEFSGEEAESPEATHNIAIFEGWFTSNRGDIETLLLKLKIIDNGEPGAGVDIFSTYDDEWYEWKIDGGNFQVHNIE